jgi:uncharacterized membrane protein YgcG
MVSMARLGILFFAFALAAPVTAQEGQTEEILAFDVSIEIEAGGGMLVTESIRIRAMGNQIKRGIYRDFPTGFPRAARLGRIEAPFVVRSVTRDGEPEPFALEAIGGDFGRDGMRVRIGRGNVFLEPGLYTYVIVYETDRWLHFGDESDQLYWNVTGNGWGFPIRSSTARIRIPELASEPTLETWTGSEGSTSTTARASWDGATRTAEFVNEVPLLPNQGMTVRLTFPSGEVTPPSEAQRDAWFRLDWGGWLDAGYVVLFVIAVYLLMWRTVGMDPAPGPTTLRREPPEGYSPAALGFIQRRGYEKRQLSAALVSMALKGAIRIDEQNGEWTIHDLGDPSVELSPEETKLYEGLLMGRAKMPLSQSHHAKLATAIKHFRTSMERRLEREYFLNNRKWFSAGLGLSVLGIGALAWRWRFDINPVALFLGLWLSIWTVGVATMGYRLWQQTRTAMAGGEAADWAAVGFLALFSIPFVVAEIVVATILSVMMPTHLAVAAFAVGLTNVVFYHLLERPTLKGRGVLDRLEGFRAYLGDPDDRAQKGGDRLTRFEHFLPFAISLGLEDRWSEAFDDVLTPAVITAAGTNRPMPWYTHDHGHRSFTTSGLSSALGSGLSSSLSSASSPPASSGSGGGGGFSSGGSSGGGGGGGGGGGW